MSITRGVFTKTGKEALILAQSGSRTFKPKSFKFSEIDYELDENLSNISGWIEKDISSVMPLGSNIIEFVCKVEPDEAVKSSATCGLFLDDGLMFAIVKPPFAFREQMLQRLKIQFEISNISEIASFEYISVEYGELQLYQLLNIANFGNIALEQEKKLEGVKCG